MQITRLEKIDDDTGNVNRHDQEYGEKNKEYRNVKRWKCKD